MARRVIIKWDGRRIAAKNRRAVAQAKREIAAEMQATMRTNISKPSPPRSKPGNYPHKETGNLHDSTTVTSEGDKIVVRVPQYGIYLEGGTRKMKPRPFIHRVIGRATWGPKLSARIKKYMPKAQGRRVK